MRKLTSSNLGSRSRPLYICKLKGDDSGGIEMLPLLHWCSFMRNIRVIASAFMQPLEWAVSGCLGSLMVVALLVLRIYLGWAYVGDRLLSASVAYEESGW